uniref:Protein kinase domain-containing protein n=1 Tax=Setaria digitata TaxID=48799 RepID=A0A915PVP2_9BILA
MHVALSSDITALIIISSSSAVWLCASDCGVGGGDGKNLCLPIPDSIYPYQKRLKFLKRALGHLLVDDVFIELTDSKLGQGAVGFVFKGYVYPRTRTRLQRVFAAVKMSYPMPQKSIGLLEEAYRLSKLDHPNIVKLIAISKLSFQVFRPMIAMEWLPGGSLIEYFREHIRKNEEPPSVYVRDIINILRQVGDALKYLHESHDSAGNEASHGDVAARNVLLTEANLSHLDRTRIVHRPESDVWMFGVLGWECVTLGAEPHYQRTVDEIQQCFTWPDRGLRQPPTCPLDVWNFLLDCMSEQHRRPRFAGSTEIVSSAIYRLQILQQVYANDTQTLDIYYNTTNCTCNQHRCSIPLPSFAK